VVSSVRKVWKLPAIVLSAVEPNDEPPDELDDEDDDGSGVVPETIGEALVAAPGVVMSVSSRP
jgi:hypothetical protein